MSKQAMVGALGAWLVATLSLFGEDEGPSNAYHRVLEGTVGKQLQVRMVLEKRGEQLEGFYFYKKNRILLSLEGEESDWDGTLKLSETSGFIGASESEPTGRWTGEFDAEGALVGIWSSPDGEKTLPFKLVEVNDADVLKVRPVHRALNCVYVRDAHQGGLIWDLKYARFSPERDGVATINQWIRSEVQASLMDYVENGTEKQKVIATATDKSIEKRLREMADEEALEMAGSAPESHSLIVHVVHNADGVLCLGMYQWAYEGGGHGNGFSEYVVFDVSTGKKLQLDRVLKAGYQKSLAEMGARILRDRANVGADAPLSEVGLFEDRLKLNGNWFVTVEGIGFSYSPYEIASFSRGFVAFTIPFADLKPWLKEDTLVSRLASQESTFTNQDGAKMEANHTARAKRYYKLASQALANKEHYFDQQLDSISMAIYQKVFDEGIRTQMAGTRDKAKLRFSADPHAAGKLVSAAGPVPTNPAEVIELATWMVVAAKLDQLTDEQQLDVEQSESR